MSNKDEHQRIVDRMNDTLASVDHCRFCGTPLKVHSVTSEKQEEKCPNCGFNQVRYK